MTMLLQEGRFKFRGGGESFREMSFSPLSESHGRRGERSERYENFSKLLGFDVLNPPLRITQALADSPLGDALKIGPSPVLLDSFEARTLTEATTQYGRALHEFFKDLVLGTGRILDHRRGIPSSVLSIILSSSEFRNLESLRNVWVGRCPSDIVFSLGPDFGRAGPEALYELNVGNLGGFADVCVTSKAYFAIASGASPSDRLGNFFYSQDLSTSLLAALDGKFKTSRNHSDIINYAPHRFDNRFSRLSARQIQTQDLESVRWSDRLHAQGVACVAPEPRKNSTPHNPKVVLNYGYSTQDSWLVEMWLKGDTKLLTPPGVVEILGNKLLLPYLESIVEFYLNEEIKVSPPRSSVVEIVRRGANNFVLRDIQTGALVDKIDCLPLGVVFKSGGGYGGKEIVICLKGERLDSKLVASAFAASGKNFKPGAPQNFILRQEFIEPSFIGAFRSVMRSISFVVGDGDCIVTELPDCRGQRMTAPTLSSRQSLKVNVAQGANLIAVFGDRSIS